MALLSIENTGNVVPEPDWMTIFTDGLEIKSAKEFWRIITTELRDRKLLSPANAHSIQRLICAYLMFDRMYREVAEKGVVLKPKKGNVRSIARISPEFTAMREAGSDASALEAELGLAPRRRSAASKAERKTKVATPADAYLERSGV